VAVFEDVILFSGIVLRLWDRHPDLKRFLELRVRLSDLLKALGAFIALVLVYVPLYLFDVVLNPVR